jgi:AraC-like DNA-binding protein
MRSVLRELTAPMDSSLIVKQELGPQFKAPFHFHKGFELTYIREGHGKFYGGNKVMNFNSGDIYFFGPGFAHYFVNEKSFIVSGKTAHSVAVQFNVDFLGEVFFQKPELRRFNKLLDASIYGIKMVDNDNRADKLFLELTSATGLKSLITLLQLFELLSEKTKSKLSIISSSETKNLITQSDSNKLEPVFNYIFQNFKDQVNSRKAASLVYLNEAAFCRYFKRRTNKTFSQFVNEVRITHAAELLEKTDEGIAQICFECGFNSISYFNRQFKILTGRNPFQFRKDNNIKL